MEKNILVTGSHRSGTTWTGRVIARAKSVRYVQEPFNLDNPGIDSPITYWYEYLKKSPLNHQKRVKQYLNSFSYSVFHKHTLKRLAHITSFRGGYEFLTDVKDRIISARTVYKDPIALMSAEWIYEKYNWDIVVLIRHPAAFVASCKLKNWGFDFSNFLDQDELMDDYLKDYTKTIQHYATTKKDIVDQCILAWNIMHEVIHYYEGKYKDDWYFVKHETLSKDSITEFEKLFSKLDLKFTGNVEDYILQTTTSNKASKLKRNSVENIKTWKQRLTPEEIERIKAGTKKVWTKFYTEDDW